MHTWKRMLFSLAVMVLAAGYGLAGELPTAKPKDVGLDPDKIQKVHDAVQSLTDKKEVAGAVVAVARKGKVVLFDAFGESEAGRGKTMKAVSMFCICTQTNTITSI